MRPGPNKRLAAPNLSGFVGPALLLPPNLRSSPKVRLLSNMRDGEPTCAGDTEPRSGSVLLAVCDVALILVSGADALPCAKHIWPAYTFFSCVSIRFLVLLHA